MIIPAIDIIDGKCVRLTQGDYAQKKVYNENPLEEAKRFEAFGINRLHLVDLDGAKKGKVVNYKVLEQIASQTKLIIDFGGGIKTEESIQQVFNSGAHMATIGSIAVKNKELFFSWIKKYGAKKFMLGADVKDEKIAISGWLENTNISIFDFLEENINNGVENIFCTDVYKDGMLQGPGVELYKKIIAKFPSIHLVGSGGISSINDVLLLREIGCTGVIVGKAIYEGKITVQELQTAILQKNN